MTSTVLITQTQEIPRRSYSGFLSLYFAVLFLWGFDYKAEAAGTGILVQAPIFVFHMLATTAILVVCGRSKKIASSLWLFVAAALFFLVGTSLVGLENGQPYWGVMVNTVPLLVLITTAMATYVLLSRGIDPVLFRIRLQNFCLLFILTHFAIALILSSGINLTTSRYAYLSGAAIPACAILAMGFFVRFGIREIILSITNLLIIQISVTRTELVIIAGQVASVFVVSPKVFFRTSSIKRAITVRLLIVAILLADGIAGTGLAQRWIERLTVYSSWGVDPTALTRIAENNDMLENFTASLEQIMWGNGIAAPAKLSGYESNLAASLIGHEAASIHDDGFGHNNYISLLFTGGLAFGAPLLVLIVWNGLQAASLIRQLVKGKVLEEASAYIGIWGSLIILGMMMSGLLSATFVDRAACLWYGVGLGTFYWMREALRRKSTSP